MGRGVSLAVWQNDRVSHPFPRSCRLAVPVFLALVLLAGSAWPRPASLVQAFDVHVPIVPAPVPVEGAMTLVYEVHLTSFADETVTLTRVDVIDAGDGTTLGSFVGDGLDTRLAGPGREPGRVVAPGARAVLYVELALPDRGPPAELVHRLHYRFEQAPADGAGTNLTGGRRRVGSVEPVALGPPLRGGPWAAIHHPQWQRGHRRVIYAVDGRARVPGRFAVDWVRLDADGRQADGAEDEIEHWFGYGADVLAVADARVVVVRDDVPESPTLSRHDDPPITEAAGNYLVLALGAERYAFYEHLQPGSIRVRPGQTVRRGQVIAGLGFTGQSTGPHLHFHVADASAPLAAEGLPFVIDAFTLLGGYPEFGDFGKAPWRPLERGLVPGRSGEMPGPNRVVRFP